MSTDKTLADVQPGGRVRLGDQTERARFEAWAEERELGTAKCSADGMKGDYADLNTDWCWAAWRAALSAQPSPGGQGDSNGRIDIGSDVVIGGRKAKVIGLDPYTPCLEIEWTDAQGGKEYRPREQMILAARQPVYEGHTWISDYVLAGLRERAAMPLQLRNGEVWHWQGDGHDFPESLVCPVIMSAETLRALLAARQPVGEPVAWYYGFSDTGEAGPVTFGGNPGAEAIAWAERHGHTLHYLYAAPPAQAVDVEDVLGKAMDMAKGGCGSASVVEWITEQLIDSPAVGNG